MLDIIGGYAEERAVAVLMKSYPASTRAGGEGYEKSYSSRRNTFSL